MDKPPVCVFSPALAFGGKCAVVGISRSEGWQKQADSSMPTLKSSLSSRCEAQNEDREDSGLWAEIKCVGMCEAV